MTTPLLFMQSMADSGTLPNLYCSHPPSSRLSLLSARPVVTFPAAVNHCPLVGTKLYCLVTEAHMCEQLAQGCCNAALHRAGFEVLNPRPVDRKSNALPVVPPCQLKDSGNKWTDVADCFTVLADAVSTCLGSHRHSAGRY